MDRPWFIGHHIQHSDSNYYDLILKPRLSFISDGTLLNLIWNQVLWKSKSSWQTAHTHTTHRSHYRFMAGLSLCPLLIFLSLYLSSLFLCWHWISNKQTGLLSRSLILTPCFNQWKETPQSILQHCLSPCFLHPFFNYLAVWNWRLLWRKSFLTLWTSGVGLIWSYFVQHCPQSYWYVCLWTY